MLLLIGAADAPPDGYSCSEQAGTLLVSGRFEVQISTDAAYRRTAASISYRVVDRVGGRGRMAATWQIDGKAIAAGVGDVFIPLWRERDALPLTVAVSLDGKPVGVRRLEARGDRVVAIDPDGRQSAEQTPVAAMSNVRDPWIPDVLGHALLSYSVSDADGRVVGGDQMLLPDRPMLMKVIGPALKRAERRRESKDCDRVFVVRGS